MAGGGSPRDPVVVERFVLQDRKLLRRELHAIRLDILKAGPFVHTARVRLVRVDERIRKVLRDTMRPELKEIS